MTRWAQPKVWVGGGLVLGPHSDHGRHYSGPPGGRRFGPIGSLNYQATVGPLTAATNMTLSADDTTRIRMPDAIGDYNLFQVTTWTLVPGRRQAFNEAIDKYQAAITEADAPFYHAFIDPIAGSTGPSKTGVFFEKNWAGFAADDPTLAEIMTEKYGEEGFAGIVEQITSSFVSTESQILRIRRDLSIVLDEGM